MAKKKTSKKIGKSYTKTHSNPKAVAGHVKNIKKRGGRVISEIHTKSKTSLVYGFPD